MIEESPGKDADLIFGGGLAPFVNYDMIVSDDERWNKIVLKDFLDA